MGKLRVLEGQTLLDIAIEKYGHLAGVFSILEDNKGYSITSIPVPGSEINIRTDIVDLDQDAAYIRQYFANRNISISSGIKIESEDIIDTGLYVDEDYWEGEYTDEN